MHNRLRFDSLVLGVLLSVGGGACSPATPQIASQPQATPPTLSASPAVVPKPSVVPAASVVPKPSVAASPVASPVAVASPSPVRAAALASPSASAAIAAPRPAGVSLILTAPTADETISAGSVTVTVSYAGPALVAVANATKLDDYHLHYMLDVDPTPYIGTTLPVPLGDPRIIHSGATSVTYDNIAAGTHTLAVLMTGSNHISVNPPVTDKVTFTSR